MHRSSLPLRPCPEASSSKLPEEFYRFTSLAFARIAFFNGFPNLLAQFRAVDKCLLRPAQQGAQRQINRKSGRHAPAESTKHQRPHESHDLLLRWIHAALRCALLLHEHGNDDNDRQHMQWVWHSKIVYPEPVRLSQLNGVVQHRVKGKQERHLQQQWETATHWIDAFFFIERLHFLLHVRAAWIGKAIAFVLLLNGFHLRLDSLHPQ